MCGAKLFLSTSEIFEFVYNCFYFLNGFYDSLFLRYTYFADFNADGLIDIFFFNDRRKDNENAVGRMMINQGSRKFIADPNVMEYARTALLHDADGDGYAEEFVVQRSACYPQRLGPDTDPRMDWMGPWPDERIEFCRSRPQGSTAVFKFVQNEIQLISESYWITIEEDTERSALFCAHGRFVNNVCHATSSASLDFDNDQKADLIIIFRKYMLLYLSSDRPNGELPLRDNYSLMKRWPETCDALGIRVVDFDLDGKEEVLIVCREPGTHVMFRIEDGKFEVQEEAVEFLNDENLTRTTEEQFNQVCSSYMDGTPEEDVSVCFDEICFDNECTEYLGLDWSKGTSGLAIVDLNNDGYMDIVLTQTDANMAILRNKPPDILNKYVAFVLHGTISNYYGIGATVLLEASNMETNRIQLREISSVQHVADKRGTKDDRIVFGLGVHGIPETLTIRWPAPHHSEQILDLRNWSGQGSGTMVDPYIVTEHGEP